MFFKFNRLRCLSYKNKKYLIENQKKKGKERNFFVTFQDFSSIKTKLTVLLLVLDYFWNFETYLKNILIRGAFKVICGQQWRYFFSLYNTWKILENEIINMFNEKIINKLQLILNYLCLISNCKFRIGFINTNPIN